jgi:hypothetical protein
MINDMGHDNRDKAERGNSADTPIEQLGLCAIRIAALPLLLVAIITWGSIVGTMVLIRAIARSLEASPDRGESLVGATPDLHSPMLTQAGLTGRSARRPTSR